MKYDINVCVVDNGLFPELALRLARDFAKVYYFTPWEDAFPVIEKRLIGDNVPGIIRVQEPFQKQFRQQVQLYVFPDIFHSGIQQMLEELGYDVWGSRAGDELETNRVFWKQKQTELGLPTGNYTIIYGLTDLTNYLKERPTESCYIKTTSRLRGTMETWEHRGWPESMYKIRDLYIKFGPAAEEAIFVVEEPIKTEFEPGFDTYCIDGQFPTLPIQGYEVKSRGMLYSAQTRTNTPDLFDDVMRKLGPVLAEYNYRNFFSAEFRQKILIDPCCRAPNPGLGLQLEMIENLSDIILYGAKGRLIEPKFVAEYGFQIAFTAHEIESGWIRLKIDPAQRQWYKFVEFCADGEYIDVTVKPGANRIGWVLGLGDTVQDAFEHLKHNAELLPKGCQVDLEAAEQAVDTVIAAEKAGLEFAAETVKPVDAS